tara:strand:- start:73 stop:666 length:594 start_codon:yes stop_codon:yes gene_type:complete
MNISKTIYKKYKMLKTDLDIIWEKNLKLLNVKLPKRGRKRCALDYLYQNIGVFIHIDKIKEHVSKQYKLTGTDPVQVRHLSTQDGWNIIKQGKYMHCLVDVNSTCPSFISEKRNVNINNIIWNNLKFSYEFMCVNCGSKEDEPQRWDNNNITKLQKGHMDPTKSLTEDNCIPQCQFCNRRYKDKAVFDKRGQVLKFL